MAMKNLPEDFKDFLKLLNSQDVEYLLIGGYAVGYHGYPRATADMDIWIATNPRNAKKVTEVIKEFGYDVPELSEELFQKEDQIIRMGVPPFRIEILTTISGVRFEECYANRIIDKFSGIEVNFISLKDLLINKKASARYKDLNDLEHLSS